LFISAYLAMPQTVYGGLDDEFPEIFERHVGGKLAMRSNGGARRSRRPVNCVYARRCAGLLGNSRRSGVGGTLYLDESIGRGGE